MIDFWFSAFVLIVAIIGVILFWYRAAQRQEVLGRLSKVESEAVSYTHLTLPTIYSV